jgi:ribosome-associated toxin RatA of RatAB toxin-antitoxin module
MPVNFVQALGLLGTLAIAHASYCPHGLAGILDNPVEQFPVRDRVKLRDGDWVFRKQADSAYIGHILVQASAADIWAVLTDYNNYPNFWPNVENYRVLGTKQRTPTAAIPSQTILEVESTTTAQVLFVRAKSTNRFEIVETPLSRIDFSLLASQDLERFSGYWLLEPVDSFLSDRPQVLVTYRATVKPSAVPSGLFADILRQQLVEGLEVLQQEAQKRAALEYRS